MKRTSRTLTKGNVVFWNRLGTIIPAIVLDTSRCWFIKIGYGEGNRQMTMTVHRRELSLTHVFDFGWSA